MIVFPKALPLMKIHDADVDPNLGNVKDDTSDSNTEGNSIY